MVDDPAPAPVARTPSERTQHSAMGGGRTVTLPEASPEIGFSPSVMLVFGLGVAFLLLTGLLRAVVATSDDPSEGIYDTSIWFGWLGASMVALSLVAAGLVSKTASLGVRAALIAVGSYLFIQASDADAGLFAAMAPFF